MERKAKSTVIWKAAEKSVFKRGRQMTAAPIETLELSNIKHLNGNAFEQIPVL